MIFHIFRMNSQCIEATSFWKQLGMSEISVLHCNNMPFRWSPLHQKCFDHIKLIACRMLILKPINWDIPLDIPEVGKDKYKVWVITDACSTGMGAVLAQGEDWRTSRPAAFMLKKFT